MNPFSIEGARYYCSSFTRRTGDAEQSLEDFSHSQLGGLRSITEGTDLFEDYRSCALREAERSLFLAASHYRRALHLMMPDAAHWAHVTLYYGTFFAAHGLLAMLGCSVLNGKVVHVRRSSPGNQELQVQRFGNGTGQYFVSQSGSHRRFWEAFYRTTTGIRSLVDQSNAVALVPVANNITWLIDQRNRLNYRSAESIRLGGNFSKSFSESTFPGCLPGELNTQYRVSEGMLSAGFSLATTLGLATDALDTLNPPAGIRQKIREIVYGSGVPNLVGKTRFRELFST